MDCAPAFEPCQRAPELVPAVSCPPEVPQNDVVSRRSWVTPIAGFSAQPGSQPADCSKRYRSSDMERDRSLSRGLAVAPERRVLARHVIRWLITESDGICWVANGVESAERRFFAFLPPERLRCLPAQIGLIGAWRQRRSTAGAGCGGLAGQAGPSRR